MAFARARPCTRTHTDTHQWESVTVVGRVLLLDPSGTGYGDGTNRLCSRPARPVMIFVTSLHPAKKLREAQFLFLPPPRHEARRNRDRRTDNSD